MMSRDSPSGPPPFWALEADAGVRESGKRRGQAALELGARDLAILLEHDVHAAGADIDTFEHTLDARVFHDQRGNAVGHPLGLLERRSGWKVMFTRVKSLFCGGKNEIDKVPNRMMLTSRVATPAQTIEKR